VGDREIELTLMWREHNCHATFDPDFPDDCDSRASFRFSLEDLGIQDMLIGAEGRDAALQSLVVVDAYFAQEIRSARQYLAKGSPLPITSRIHLVVRVMRAPESVGFEPATPEDANREALSRYRTAT
jgi:hypothetical protein